MLLVLVLERSDAAALIGISLREMEKGRGVGRARVALGRRMGAGQMGAEVSLIELPTLEPAIGSGNRKREAFLVPNVMEGRSLSDSANQLEKVACGDAGAGDEMTPQDRERPATTFAVMAIGAKKRNLRTSR